MEGKGNDVEGRGKCMKSVERNGRKGKEIIKKRRRRRGNGRNRLREREETAGRI